MCVSSIFMSFYAVKTTKARVSTPLLSSPSHTSAELYMYRKLQFDGIQQPFMGENVLNNPDHSGLRGKITLRADYDGTFKWELFENDCVSPSALVQVTDRDALLTTKSTTGEKPAYVANTDYQLDLILSDLYDHLQVTGDPAHTVCWKTSLFDPGNNYIDHYYFKNLITLSVDKDIALVLSVDDTDLASETYGLVKDNPVLLDFVDSVTGAPRECSTFGSNDEINFRINVPVDTMVDANSLNVILQGPNGPITLIDNGSFGSAPAGFGPTFQPLDGSGGGDVTFFVPKSFMFDLPFGVLDMQITGDFFLDKYFNAVRRLQIDNTFVGTRQSFSVPLIIKNPKEKSLSPAAYGGIVFAMTFVIGIAGAIAFAAHKRRSNPQVYPAKKSTDAKTLKTSTTISSFGSDRSIDSNIRSVPTGVTKSQRDIETQLHAPRSQHSMKSPTRINDSQHNTKVQRSTKPTKSNKSTTCVGGGDRRPRSHHDAPSSRGSRRNMEHHRVASPRATTGRNGGRITSQGKPKPSSRDLHRPNSQPSASLKHHRKERKPTPKCHPSNEELV